jgi:hypothetical protein
LLLARHNLRLDTRSLSPFLLMSTIKIKRPLDVFGSAYNDFGSSAGKA